MRDLLECAWPAALDTARQPVRSPTWIAGVPVIASRDGGDFARTRRRGPPGSGQAVRREITRRGGQTPCLRIVRGLFTALADPAAVSRTGPARWSGCSCWPTTGSTPRTRLTETQRRMGDFTWHKHDDTDELFLVLSGELTIQMRDRNVVLGPHELFVVRRGVEHCPRADTETAVLLLEPGSVINTGDAGGEFTAEVEALS
jgi:mannose-6-phosphate isomerase-like protein (cupin superfamily)